MRTKRFLLVTAALSASALACGKETSTTNTQPLPANPKGTFYDAGVQTPDPPPPANPKGSFYEAGTQGPPPLAEAGASATAKASASPPPKRDAGVREPIRNTLPANPKGSHYDAGRGNPNDPLPF